jgi:hypothetical protein
MHFKQEIERFMEIGNAISSRGDDSSTEYRTEAISYDLVFLFRYGLGPCVLLISFLVNFLAIRTLQIDFHTSAYVPRLLKIP